LSCLKKSLIRDFNVENDYSWTVNEKRMLKYALENDGMCFLRYFFKLREGSKFLLNWHHFVIEYVLQQVYSGHIKRLIINIAPGYTKTEQAVINFISRGLALNPRAKFIHASYSADLAHENSSAIREVVSSVEFQALWPMKLRTDTIAKRRWFTEHGGGMMAAAAGGQITGFRAGRMTGGFSGALVIDDPVKPGDAYSTARREAINARFNNTLRSRLAVETVPIVLIMQRIHDDDLTGYLLRGGSGEKWHHLAIPSLLSAEAAERQYPVEFDYGEVIDLNVVLDSLIRGLERL